MMKKSIVLSALSLLVFCAAHGGELSEYTGTNYHSGGVMSGLENNVVYFQDKSKGYALYCPDENLLRFIVGNIDTVKGGGTVNGVDIDGALILIKDGSDREVRINPESECSIVLQSRLK